MRNKVGKLRSKNEAFDLTKNTPIRDATLMMIEKVREIIQLLKAEQVTQDREGNSVLLDENQVNTLSDLLESFGVSLTDLDTATHRMLGFPDEYLIFSEDSQKDSKRRRTIKETERKVLRKRRKQGRVNKKKK